MAGFPTMDNPIAVRPVVKGVDSFFNDVAIHPNDWTPLTFANYASTTSWKDYGKSIDKLRRSNTCLRAFAAQCHEWLIDPSNGDALDIARLRLAEKLASQKVHLATNSSNLQDSLNMRASQRAFQDASTAVPAYAWSSSAHVPGPTTHIPNPAFSLPSHDLDNDTESSMHITDPASSLDSRSARSTYIPIAESVQVGQKHPRDPFDNEDAGLPKAPRNRSPLPTVVSRSDVLDTGRSGSPAPSAPRERPLPDSNGTRDDEQTSPPGQPAPSEPSLRDSIPSSPSTELASGTRVDIQPGLSTSMSNTAQKGGGLEKISTGRSLTLEDLSPHQEPSLRADDGDCTPPIYSPMSSLGPNLPSSDPADSSFVYQGDPAQSTTRLYSWDFLDGPGRVDSDVDSPWVYNGTAIGAALMKFRRRTIENNGGYTETHQKLAVNFIFLVEEEYRTDGLQGEVGDKIWDAICDAVREKVQPLPKTVVNEVHDWAHRLANNKMWEFEQMLEESPPEDRNLKAILRNMTNNSQYWNTQPHNEDTYLKDLLGPFLDIYFGKLRYAKSHWTPTQDDTRDQESSTLIPDYGTSTLIGGRRYFVLLLEGKIAGNAGQCQMWDDLTKIGQEMKLALDSMLKLMPCGDVCVVGVLVREPLTEFFSMRIHAEGTYVMHKFASAFIASGATNAFPILRLMEVCEHAKKIVERTIDQIRSVKEDESTGPKVPLSWLRPSFRKPKRYQIWC
ncbi:hypothetical protein BGX26_003173 [Mortierella sp. AD094]|nr:hypothetical protein BGX26_003173 [Mortierella sp. AD094]